MLAGKQGADQENDHTDDNGSGNTDGAEHNNTVTAFLSCLAGCGGTIGRGTAAGSDLGLAAGCLGSFVGENPLGGIGNVTISAFEFLGDPAVAAGGTIDAGFVKSILIDIDLSYLSAADAAGMGITYIVIIPYYREIAMEIPCQSVNFL
jgi:hypothetical protein